MMASKYTKLENIGSGSFGTAWLVIRRHTDRRYVLKEVPVLGMSEKAKKQALTEVRALSRCHHANVIRYKEAFVDNMALCIIMEYADGGDLSRKIEMNQGILFETDLIMDWIIQICFALRSIHNLNIIHRDLKTQNIFIMASGMIKVGDLGIARILSINEDHAVTAVGTPYYLSPEMCARKPYDYKTDMWAAGCVLYELCTFNHPFEGSCLGSLVLKITKGIYEPIPKSYGPVLDDLLSVLLDTDPQQRPSAEQVLGDPSLQPYVSAYVNRTDTTKEKHVVRSPYCNKTPEMTKEPKYETPSSSVRSSSRKRSVSTPRSIPDMFHNKRPHSAELKAGSVRHKAPKSNLASPRISLYKEILQKRKPLAALALVNSPHSESPRHRISHSRRQSGQGNDEPTKPGKHTRKGTEITSSQFHSEVTSWKNESRLDSEVPKIRNVEKTKKTGLLCGQGQKHVVSENKAETLLIKQVCHLLENFCTGNNVTAGKQEVIRHFLQKKLGTGKFHEIHHDMSEFFNNLSKDKTVRVCLPLLIQLLQWEHTDRYVHEDE